MRIAWTCVVLLSCLAALPACGSDAASTTTGSASADRDASGRTGSTTGTTAAGGTGGGNALTADLELRYSSNPDATGAEEATVFEGELTCPATDAAGEDACAALEAGRERMFAPDDPDMACTEIYGGPQRARVEGTLEGKPVKQEFSRTNGCEISRWDSLQPLLDALGVPAAEPPTAP